MFERKSLIKNGKVCSACDFMEVVAVKNDVKMCRYDCVDCNGQMISEFYVFVNEKYSTTIDRKNVKQILSFFKR